MLVGLTRPKVNTVSCRRRMVAMSPFRAAVLSVWNNLVVVVSNIVTFFSFISFRMSTASEREKEI